MKNGTSGINDSQRDIKYVGTPGSLLYEGKRLPSQEGQFSSANKIPDDCSLVIIPSP